MAVELIDLIVEKLRKDKEDNLFEREYIYLEKPVINNTVVNKESSKEEPKRVIVIDL